ALVRQAAPYTELPRERFDELITLVAHGIETPRGPRGRYVHHDAINGELRARKGARIAAATSGGAIPEMGDYRVVAEPDDTIIGSRQGTPMAHRCGSLRRRASAPKPPR